MPRSALACGVADGMCHVDQRPVGPYSLARVSVCISCCADVLSGSVFLVGRYRLAFFCSLFSWVYVATDKVDNRSSIWFWRRIPGGLWAKCPTSPMKILYGIIS